MIQFKAILPIALACGIASFNAGAQAPITAYPNRPVSLVIPFAAGGTTDAEARIYTQKLQELTGQPWVFDFRAGAGTTVGSAYVARATPDGYTLLMNNSGMAVFPNFHPDLPFDVLKSFIPITQLSDRVTSLVVSPVALPNVHNLKDLVAYAKPRPGELTCGTGSGAGGISHIVCESLASAAGIAIAPVHYKGAAQAAVDLIAGRIHMNAGAYFNAMPNVKAGKLRVISILNTERAKMLPNMPTAIEQGFDVEYPSWLGVFAPAGMPPALVNRIHGELVKAVRAPDVLKQLDAQGSIAVANSPEAFRKRLVDELARWKKVVQEKGIKVDAGG